MAEQAPSRLLKWVLAPLSDVVPARVKALFFGVRTAHRLEFRIDANEVSRANKKYYAPIGLLSGTSEVPSAKDVVIVDAVVPSGHFLRREVSAPRRASVKLSAVAGLDLQRQTPFHISDIEWLLGQARTSDKQIVVDQWIAKKSDLELWRSRLSSAGLIVRRIFVKKAEEFGPIADYSAEVSPNISRWRILNGLLLMLIIGLGAIAWSYPALQLGSQLDDLNSQRDTLRTEALALRPQIENLRSFNAEKAAFLDVINHRALLSESLKEVTIALPDAVWLESFVFTTNQVVIIGETKQSAPELVLELSKESGFSNPRLTGPVSKSSAGAERFEITLDLPSAP